MIINMISSHAVKSPNSLAIQCGNEQVTYSELLARANKLAAYLRRSGAGEGALIGICLPRSVEMVVGILATLIVGGAYVPIDPSYPKDRITFMLDDANVFLVLTESALIDIFSKHNSRLVCVDREAKEIEDQSADRPANVAPPKSLAYVLYTSGSTGTPKGVMVSRQSLSAFVRVTQSALDVAKDDVYLQTASINYALSVRQLMAPLSCGACIVVASTEESRDPIALFELIKHRRVTLMDVVPSLWRTCINRLQALPADERKTLLNNHVRRIVSVGEPLLFDIPYEWQIILGHSARLVNIFGQTETTGVVASYDVEPAKLGNRDGVVPIGRSIADTRLYILDSTFAPVPDGEVGELCVSSPCLALGYLNRPELTAEKFMPNPFKDGISDRLYRTGDLARYREDGVIEHLGRGDHQVKIRGQRLELGEVEAALQKFPTVRQCAVVAKGNSPDERFLAAFIIASETISVKELQTFMRSRVPDYMVPTAYQFLDAFPLTPNGKLDRLALQESTTPSNAEPEAIQIEQPRSVIEQKIADLWKVLLNRTRIGINDNFFDLGGHSLLAVRLFSQIERILGVRLPLATLLRSPTISSLAAEIQNLKKKDSASPVLISIQSGMNMPPFFCVHGLGGSILGYSDLVRALGSDIPFYGLQAIGLESDEIHDTTIEEMASHYVSAILSFQPQGPYRLGGYCFGGVVAFEMACQMEKLGEKPDFVAIFEGFAPSDNRRNYSPSLLNPERLAAIVKSMPAWIKDYSTMGSSELRRRIRSTFSRGWLITQRHAGQRKKIRAQNLLDTDLAMIPDRQMDLTLSHIEALRKYRPTPYDGRVTVFRASHQSFNEVLFGSLDPEMGWGRIAKGGVDVRLVNGYHRNIHLKPYVESLSKELRVCLDSSIASREG